MIGHRWCTSHIEHKIMPTCLERYGAMQLVEPQSYLSAGLQTVQLFEHLYFVSISTCVTKLQPVQTLSWGIAQL